MFYPCSSFLTAKAFMNLIFPRLRFLPPRVGCNLIYIFLNLSKGSDTQKIIVQNRQIGTVSIQKIVVQNQQIGAVGLALLG